jgi:uncharacterized membrane protein required for colicin V production
MHTYSTHAVVFFFFVAWLVLVALASDSALSIQSDWKRIATALLIVVAAYLMLVPFFVVLFASQPLWR